MNLVRESIFEKPSTEELRKRLERLSPNHALEISIERNFVEGVKDSIKRGGDYISSKVITDNPIYTAIMNGNTEAALYAVKHGVSISQINIVLRTAALQGNLKMVKSLINRGADESWFHWSSVMDPIEAGHLDIVQYFFEERDLKDNKEVLDLAIKTAKEYNKKDMLKYLLKLSNE